MGGCCAVRGHWFYSFLYGLASQDVLTKELCRQQRARTLAEQSREPESPKSNDVASGMDTPSYQKSCVDNS